MPWAGTFHAVANRLLRHHAPEAGLDPSFTLLDREDAADLIDRLRHERELSRTDRRFPRKGTCLAIYSSVVNTQESLRACLEARFPWCLEWEEALRGLFAAYVDAKSARAVLDYDDLLLYWYHLMTDHGLARRVGGLFDHVLVDEYQDTNTLQAEILRRLKPDGRGVTVVGDDAQSIYSFRAARVGNILAFPRQYDPPATVVTLEQNYRSTPPILEAANAVIALSTERHEKTLFSARAGGARPALATVHDEMAQVEYVATRVLERREAGVPLRQQAVLFRSSHHSDALEIELGRRNIPFVKFGGLRFLEAAHVKDALACLRWAENPRDTLAAFRVAQLLPGMGPRLADGLLRHVAGARFPSRRCARDLHPARRHARRLAGLRRAVPAPRRGRILAWRRADGPRAALVRAAPRAALRRRPRPARRPRAARAAGRRRAVARALPLRSDARSAAGHRRGGGRSLTSTRTT